MSPLEPAQRTDAGLPIKERIAAHLTLMEKGLGRRVTWTEAKRAYRELQEFTEIWMNELYTVVVRRETPGGWVHLSIRRNDRAPTRDWRDLQQIKNQLVGEECEGVELFPAESRLMDTANQYHLWCCPRPDWRFPLGYTSERNVGTAEEAERMGARQRQA